jgi:hypothetical protein
MSSCCAKERSWKEKKWLCMVSIQKVGHLTQQSSLSHNSTLLYNDKIKIETVAKPLAATTCTYNSVDF